MIDSASIVSETASSSPQADDVRNGPVLSAFNDSAEKADASSDSQTTCQQNPSCADRTSAAQHPSLNAAEQDQSSEEDLYTLSPRQRQTIEFLLAGQSIVQIAAHLRITTRTIRRWKNAVPEFIAEYNRRVAEHSADTAVQLRHMVDLALAQVRTVMASRDTKLKTAASLRILSTLIGRNLVHSHGPTQSTDVITSFMKERLRSCNENDKAPLTITLRQSFVNELAQYLADERYCDLQQQDIQTQQTVLTPAAPVTPESVTSA